MRSRGIRRKNTRRKKERAKKLALLPSFGFVPWTSEEITKEWANKNADHLKTCSCEMCGNPRRYGKGKNKLTLQEQRALENAEHD